MRIYEKISMNCLYIQDVFQANKTQICFVTHNNAAQLRAKLHVTIPEDIGLFERSKGMFLETVKIQSKLGFEYDREKSQRYTLLV